MMVNPLSSSNVTKYLELNMFCDDFEKTIIGGLNNAVVMFNFDLLQVLTHVHHEAYMSLNTFSPHSSSMNRGL